MRKLILISAAVLMPLAAHARDITADDTVRGFVTTSVLAAKVAQGCKKISVSTEGLLALQLDVTAHIEAENYTVEEAAPLQDAAFNAEIEEAALAQIKERGFDPQKAKDLCAFGTEEMTKGSPVGAVLESR